MIIYHWAENVPPFWIHSCYKVEEARLSDKRPGWGYYAITHCKAEACQYML